MTFGKRSPLWYPPAMSIEGIADELAREWKAIENAPAIFFASLALLTISIWKVVGWRNVGIIEALNERIKLREDQIAHLKINAAVQSEIAPQLVTAAIPPHVQAPPQPAAPVEAREFVGKNVTVEYLTGLYRDRTHVEGDKLAQFYIGKWIELSGKIEIMTRLRTGISITVQIFSVEKRSYHAWMMFEGDKENLEDADLHGVIKAAGQIKQIEADQLILINCELLSTAGYCR